MNVYLVGSTDDEVLGEMVTKSFGDKGSYKVTTGMWLVAAKGVKTSSDAFSKLYKAARDQSPEVPVTNTIIVQIDSYYGYWDAAIWQWIKARRST